MNDLANKVIVIVGGNGNLGSRTYKSFMKNSSKVVIIDSYLNRINDIIKTNQEYKENTLLIDADISNEDEIKKSLAQIIDKWSCLDVLINFSHYKGNPNSLDPKSNFFSSLESYPLDEWKKTLDVNLTGLFITTKIFGAQMIKQKSGNIINTSSTYGIVSPRNDIYGDSGINSPVGYATTKSAIINFTKYVATHWSKHNIRANILSPGGISDPNQSEEFVKEYIRNTPLGRMSDVDDYQKAIMFLASNDSSYMTGSNLIIDGGWTAW